METNKTQGLPWIKTGNEFSQMSSTIELVENLPIAIYSLKCNPRTEELYLEKIEDAFTFNTRIYGLEDKFIEHVIRTFENTDKNLGVLLNGEKGTGKTICAKIIANRMGLPVILCDNPYDNIAPFIAQFNAPAIFFFDEFEKNFKDNTELLLSVMDGAYNTQTRKIFLITTNNLHINSNFLSRPSRIRYKKTFGNLSQEVVREYCDENLKNKDFLEEIVSFIDSLTISTIDILKAVVEEVNLHNCHIDEFEDFFNTETAPYKYEVISANANNLYSVEAFKQDIAKYEANPDDKDLNDNNKRSSFDSNLVTCSIAVNFLRVGENFNGEEIVYPLDENGIIITNARYYDDEPFNFYKIKNTGFKPSLFHPVMAF